jgi:hypothetical protein
MGLRQKGQQDAIDVMEGIVGAPRIERIDLHPRLEDHAHQALDLVAHPQSVPATVSPARLDRLPRRDDLAS